MEQYVANLGAAFSRGEERGAQRAGRNALAQYGAAAAQGDPQAMNALMANPITAELGMRMQDRASQQQARQQQLDMSQERLQMAREQAKRETELQTQRMSAQERAQAAAETEKAMAGGLHFYQNKDEAGYNQFLQRFGQDPAQFPFEQFPALYAAAGGTLEALQGAGPDYQRVGGQFVDMNNPQGGAQDIPGMAQEPGFRMATPDQAAQYGASAGQFDSENRFYPINPPKGMEITSDGQGGFTLREGSGVGGGDAAQSPHFNPGSFIDSIDSTLSDPALDWSTGALAWTQHAPGTPMKRFQTKAKQLSGKAFMEARQALKGGGQITDFEGQRAEDAIGRLDTAQSPNDYREALLELREVIMTGMQRDRGWLDTAPGKIMGMSAGQIAALDLKNLPEEEYDAAYARLQQLSKYEQQ